MTPEAQLIALLEWMGWHKIRTVANSYDDGTHFRGIDPSDRELMICPTLTLDLMHEAEVKMDEQTYRLFIGELVAILKPGEFAVRATKEQRLEALLKTLNLWKP